LIPRGGETDTATADVGVTGDGTIDFGERVGGATADGTAQVQLGDIANEFADRATDALDGTNLAPSEADTASRYFDIISSNS